MAESIRPQDTVTPLVGVWIEIRNCSTICSGTCVTPLVGVWIEITDWDGLAKTAVVTPLVGVWIEISASNSGANGS